MADRSAIEWTDATWNPIVGCSVISPGCTNCYAMAMAARIERMAAGSGKGTHYAGTTQASKAGPVWTGKLALAPDHVLLKPLAWSRRRRIFVNSMGDLFHEAADIEEIATVVAVAIAAHHHRGHVFQFLTKRSRRMRELLNREDFWENVNQEASLYVMERVDPLNPLNRRSDDARVTLDDYSPAQPPPGLWFGVSAEDQARADERIPDLLATPAAVRFVSAEPLLGPIDFERVGNLASIRAALPGVVEREERGRPSRGDGSVCGAQIDAVGSAGSSITFFQTPDHMGGFTAVSPRLWPRLDWVICGGESGPGARPMHPDWARSLRDQCAAADVPFFFKQWGEWLPFGQAGFTAWSAANRTQKAQAKRWLGTAHFNDSAGGPETHKTGPLLTTYAPGRSGGLCVRLGKRAAGRLLDGRTHNAMPGDRDAR